MGFIYDGGVFIECGLVVLLYFIEVVDVGRQLEMIGLYYMVELG